MLPESRLHARAPMASSKERSIHIDENIKGWYASDIDDQQTLGHAFRNENFKGGICGDDERTVTLAHGSKVTRGAKTSSNVAADLADAEEWKRVLGAHLAVGKPLQCPWAPTLDYREVEEEDKAVKNEESHIGKVEDPWSQFRNEIRAFREEFGFGMNDEHDEDAMDMSTDELSDDEGLGFRTPGLYKSGGPSPETTDGLRTPWAYLEKDHKEFTIFEEGGIELEMPGLEMGFALGVPVQVEQRGREGNLFATRFPLQDSRI
ncbi:uncharacterized protein DFL_005247 [Arthrobotrys flagrans]|uniref:Uncharacterized protein n=1 Tax=Arthrobotrys flagrans TaxID=97331 RepID=A0A437A7K8_ARTFL|nr:hypothetical protein DFL_005247 [Arthrobotrys flagrans]